MVVSMASLLEMNLGFGGPLNKSLRASRAMQGLRWVSLVGPLLGV